MRIALLAAPVACVLAAILPASARAHAVLAFSEPADGSVSAQAPTRVRLVFTDSVRPLSGIAAIRNGGSSVLAGAARVAQGHARELVIPLRPALREGNYTVRWRAVSDDGHRLEGVLAFGVGTGRAPPQAALEVGGSGPRPSDVVSRWLLFSGIALAVGGAIFWLAIWPRALTARGGPAGVDAKARRRGATLLLAGFVLAFAGADNLDLGGETRFDQVNRVAVLAAAAGALAAAATWLRPRLLAACVAPAAVLLVVPTLRGHALDPGRATLLDAGADLLHVAAAAAWIGGLVQLALVVPGAGRGLVMGARARLRREAAARFSAVALGAVAVVGATGLARAISELGGVEQLWSTGYGRSLLAKTALLSLLVVLAWRNRARLRSRAGAPALLGAELALLAGLLGAVAILTALQPGRQLAQTKAVERPTREPTLPAPAAGTVVLARGSGDLAVALAARPAARGVLLTTTVLGQDQLGVDGLRVTLGPGAGRPVRATACGAGCYIATLPARPDTVFVRLRGEGVASAVSFPLPATWPAPSANRLLRRAERVYRGLRTLRIRERLASSPRHAISSTFRYVAPDRVAYAIDGGLAGIQIGGVRWDRATPRARWVRSTQTPMRVPRPFWTSATDVSLLGTGQVGGRAAWRISFLDRRLPAWFELAVDRRTLRPLSLRMTASAHFMRHRYGSFDAPLEIVAPR